MDFKFIVNQVMSLDSMGYGYLDSQIFSGQLATRHQNNQNSKQQQQHASVQCISQILDTMGALSAQAQGLKQTITTACKLAGSNHRVYLKAEANQVLGFIKVGEKKLFHRDIMGNIKEISPLCVLDFYVHETVQRGGIGKQIFQKMLDKEGIAPHKFAYDRPSSKLIGFLKKHYNLQSYVPQNNNFVVFNDYFNNDKKSTSKLQFHEQNNNIIEPPLQPSPSQLMRQKLGDRNENYTSCFFNQKPSILTSTISANKTTNELHKKQDYLTSYNQNFNNQNFNSKNNFQSMGKLLVANKQQLQESSSKFKENQKQSQQSNLVIKRPQQHRQQNDKNLSEIQNKIDRTEKELQQVQKQIYSLSLHDHPSGLPQNLKTKQGYGSNTTTSNGGYGQMFQQSQQLPHINQRQQQNNQISNGLQERIYKMTSLKTQQSQQSNKNAMGDKSNRQFYTSNPPWATDICNARRQELSSNQYGEHYEKHSHKFK